jgi:glycosyltransferase involved in cell wall biosynthesis
MNALVTVVVPSYNQEKFLDKALSSIFQQEVSIEVFVMDGGSTDDSVSIIKKFGKNISGWRSYLDDGQAAAINEGVKLGSAPYIFWLNSDDWLLPNGLSKLVKILENDPFLPAAYGNVWNYVQDGNKKIPVWVEDFSERRLAIRCIASQPGALVRRSAWELVGGLDESMHMAFDYDLWWKLYKSFGELKHVDEFVAVNRDHANTKTNKYKKLHYVEAMRIVKKYYGSVPFKWRILFIFRYLFSSL